MTIAIPGVHVGHWTQAEARTGCTVVLLPEATVASGEIRGGAPATREFALLDPTRTVPGIDAVVLSGGSAFGLAAADGVVSELEAAGRGFRTRYGPVPIVVGLSLYDLGVGDPRVRPGPAEGRAAYRDANANANANATATAKPSSGPELESGALGAGTGATVDKWSGQPRTGGLATATMTAPVAGGGDNGHSGSEGGPEIMAVMAVLAVNAVGAIDDGTSMDDPGPPAPPAIGTNTTIGVVVTNAKLTKTECYMMAQSAQDGLARSLLPAHTAADGDAMVAAATGQVDVDVTHLRALVQATVVRAVRSLPATSL